MLKVLRHRSYSSHPTMKIIQETKRRTHKNHKIRDIGYSVYGNLQPRHNITKFNYPLYFFIQIMSSVNEI